jgi:GT2 family glycosyltransferase
METNGHRHKIAVIVPAYNEEYRIGAVLEVIIGSPLVDEIIVINDGSVDRTAEKVRKYDVILIDSPVNEGKGAALKKGIEATNADILVFIDADLIGFTREHLNDLIAPLLEDEEMMMTVGKFTSGRLRTDFSQKITPFLSGQRALRRQFLSGISDLSLTRFGVEIALTKHAKDCGAKVQEVSLSNISHVMKEEKLGYAKGALSRLEMYKDILKHILFERKA